MKSITSVVAALFSTVAIAAPSFANPCENTFVPTTQVITTPVVQYAPVVQTVRTVEYAAPVTRVIRTVEYAAPVVQHVQTVETVPVIQTVPVATTVVVH